MALTCSSCGAKVELSDEQRRQLAGKFFACPECGVTRRLRPKDAGSDSGTIQSPLRERLRPPRLWRPAVIVAALFVSALVMSLIWNWNAKPVNRDVFAEVDRKQRPVPAKVDIPAAPQRKIAAKPARPKADAAEVAEKPVDPPKPIEDVKAADRPLLRRVIDAVAEPAKPPIVSPPRGSAPALAEDEIDNGMLREVRELLRKNLPTGQ